MSSYFISAKFYPLHKISCNNKRSQFTVMNVIVNDKKGHNILTHIFTNEPYGLLVNQENRLLDLGLGSM